MKRLPSLCVGATFHDARRHLVLWNGGGVEKWMAYPLDRLPQAHRHPHEQIDLVRLPVSFLLLTFPVKAMSLPQIKRP